MIKTTVKISALLCLVLAMAANAQDPQKRKMAPNGTGYLEYLPADYASSGKLYPAIIFLHGSGERGTGSAADLDKVTAQGPPKLIKSGHKMCFTVNGVTECFIVLSPQTNKWSWKNVTVPFVQYALQTYRIDPDRIYVTGLSMGGEGTWFAASYADNMPNYFAAIAPMAGRAAVVDGTNVALKKIPVWAFHGDADTAIPLPAGQRPITGMLQANASPAPIFTIYPGAGHGQTWTKAYTPDHTYHNPNVYEWFLKQRRTSVVNAPPIVSAGSDLNLTLPVPVATITASASDPDGAINSYSWSKTDGPTATLSNTTSPTLSISNLVAGTYKFAVTVTDNMNATSSAEVNVMVAASLINQPPVVEAGEKKTITLPNNTSSFLAQASDPDGTITSYLWKKIGGGNVTMGSATTSTLIVSNAVAGTYVFTVKVTDNKGATAIDTVRLKVNPPLTSSTSPAKGTSLSRTAVNTTKFHLPDESSFFSRKLIIQVAFVMEQQHILRPRDSKLLHLTSDVMKGQKIV